MVSKKGQLSLFLVLCILLTSFLSIAFIAGNAGHQCNEQHCEICVKADRFSRNYRELGAAFCLLSFSIICWICSSLATLAPEKILASSLVHRKVQMNN